MALNPNLSTAQSGQQVGTTPANPINNPNVHTSQGSNTFDLSCQNALTARYGEITPFFYMSGVPRDRILLKSSHELRSYTLSSPLLSGLRMKKAYFSVPLRAMIPNTFDLMYVNPSKGDDIPDSALCKFNIVGFLQRLHRLIVYVETNFSSTTFSFDSCIWHAFQLLYLTESRGSLLDYLGIRPTTTKGYYTSTDIGIDWLWDLAMTNLCEGTNSCSGKISISDNNGNSIGVFPFGQSVGLRKTVQAFNMYFQYPNGVVSYDSTDDATKASNIIHEVFKYVTDPLDDGKTNVDFKPINLWKVIAYQMICSQFYTNDKIDNIYNSDLYLANQKALLFNITGYSSSRTFDYNGVPVEYDVFSKNCLDLVLSRFDVYKSSSSSVVIGIASSPAKTLSTLMSSTGGYSDAIYFMYNLLCFRNSLQYGDYFNGSRTQPLAVGDVTIDVNTDDNSVSVVDVTKNIQIQRFLNAANRVRSNITDYCKSIMGIAPKNVAPQPNFIADEYTYVGANETENTSDNQGYVTTNLVSRNSKYAFDIFIDEPCIVLGLCSFDSIICYTDTIERDNFHADRFDLFNPYLQNIGDQSVSVAERYGLINGVDDLVPTYGYQIRYAEYKFKYSQAHGGFGYNLPAWLMTDRNLGQNGESSLNEISIRCQPYDFDAFYTSLAYGSLAGYFHFIISFANNCTGNRAMDFTQKIL